MGAVFEELLRKFAKISNETGGTHLTPSDVIRLMVDLITIEDDKALAGDFSPYTQYLQRGPSRARIDAYVFFA